MTIDPDKVRELSNSIAAIGLINPITVRPTENGYELIAGNRRFQAHQLLNARFIDATVLNVDDVTKDTITLTENIARSNLSPVEEACQLHNLVENHPQGAEGVATVIARSLNWILDRLDILAWPESLRQHVHDHKISLSAAKRLAKITPPQVCEERIHQAAIHGINTRTAALWLQDTLAIGTPDPQTSQKTSPEGQTVYVTQTKVHCALCQELTALDQTRPIRACEPCLNTIHTALAPPPPATAAQPNQP